MTGARSTDSLSYLDPTIYISAYKYSCKHYGDENSTSYPSSNFTSR